MTGVKGVKAFVDHGFTDRDFLRHFLASPEFTTSTLKNLVPSAKASQKKEDLAYDIISALEHQLILG